MNNVIEFDLEPDWNEVEVVRQNTEKSLLSCEIDRDIVDAIIMIISELVENAIKYGNYENKHIKIHASIMLTDNDITVEVKSPVSSEDNLHFNNLDKTIQWIRGHQNPFEAYIEKLKEISIKSMSDSESGLGIVRIAYEGQSIVDFYVNDENIISVSAVYQFQ